MYHRSQEHVVFHITGFLAGLIHLSSLMIIMDGQALLPKVAIVCGNLVLAYGMYKYGRWLYSSRGKSDVIGKVLIAELAPLLILQLVCMFIAVSIPLFR